MNSDQFLSFLEVWTRIRSISTRNSWFSQNDPGARKSAIFEIPRAKMLNHLASSKVKLI